MYLGDNIIDEQIKEEILRYPTPELISKLFPGHPVRTRGVMRSPFREDKTPSFSCFKAGSGHYKAKDYSTSEVFDNIDIYRKVFPGISYVQAVNELSKMLFGRSALADNNSRNRFIRPVIHRRPHRERMRESSIVLKDIKYLLDSDVPNYLVKYWRERGISDDVISRYCVYCKYLCVNLKGRPVYDHKVGLPICDAEGEQISDDGLREAIGMFNEIGGITLRSPEYNGIKGFKGGNSSFVTMILADGTRPASPVRFVGDDNGIIHHVIQEDSLNGLRIGPSSFITGINPQCMKSAAAYLQRWVGKTINERDAKCIAAVLTAMNGSLCGRCMVVEGMFDALSLIQINMLAGRGQIPGADLIILNSVSNIGWAAPILSLEQEVRLYLDNDISSGAGRKASDELTVKIEEYNDLFATKTTVKDSSRLFWPHKDVNEALVKMNAGEVKTSKNSTNTAITRQKHKRLTNNKL